MAKNRGFRPQPQNQAAAALQGKFNQGAALHQQGKLAEAERIYEDILRQQPNHFDALHLLGVIGLQTQRTERGIELIRKAIKLNAKIAAAHSNLGNGLRDLKRPAEALTSYDRAIALEPSFAEAYNNRGNALTDLKRPAEALASCDRAIALKPDYAGAYNNRGNALLDLKRSAEALASYDRAIALEPHFAEAHNNRGNALLDLRRPAEALTSYDRAIELRPHYAEAYNNRGNTLKDLKRLAEALTSYDRAIALKPDYAEAYSNRGNALNDLKRLADALASYDRALALKPDLSGLEGLRLHTKMRLCDWSNFDAESANLISAVRNGKENTEPFAFLSIPSTAHDQLRCAKLYIGNRYPLSDKPIWHGERYGHDRIRVAYLTADFRQHPVSFLMVGMFECHDKSRFDITAISFGPDDNSEIRQRVKASFEHFVDARTFSDNQIANLVKELEIDILVDLMGFTTDSRTGIVAQRAAPIQANYLGYPGTMGAQYIDYIIADRILIPENQYEFYAEKIVVLPNSYQVNDSKRLISNKTFTRAELGLPPTGLVFCCFNNNYKMTPRVFACWMRILKQVEDSLLWLLEDNTMVATSLRIEAEARGVNAGRLIFAKRMSAADHLARHRLADLFLDTLPCNAHTTAGDALWAGLPVLTCMGETFAGRVAASVLNAIGLPELVTTTLKDYEHLAIELATNPEKLARINRKLKDNRLTAPLFDTKLFTKHIEAAYTAMYERHQAGLASDHIIVPN